MILLDVMSNGFDEVSNGWGIVIFSEGLKLGYWIMQFKSFPCSTVRIIFFLVGDILPLVLVRYEMISADLVVHALLDICHLLFNERPVQVLYQ